MPDSRLPVGKLPSELLGRLLATYATSDPTVLVGPGVGGDAAAIDLGETTLVVKSDPITFASESPAQYLVDVNANDLACLGATPRWMMVTALLPEGTTESSSRRTFASYATPACSAESRSSAATPRSRSGSAGRSSSASSSARSTATGCCAPAARSQATGCC